MANEFNIKNGFITSGNSNVYANLNVTGGITATTISATTYTNLPSFSGGTLTGLTINGNLTVTGNTSLQGLTATTISATTYQNLPTDIRTTGATYSNNTFTFTNNTGGTYSVLFNTVTGLTVNGNITVTGNTSLQGLTATTISATTYQNLPTFSGGTITGLTVNGNLTVTGNTSLQGLTATTISATTYQNLPTDIRTTGATYSNNTFTFTNNTGGTYSVLFNTVTGLTVNGALTVTGNTSLQGLTATTISATTYQNLPSFSGGTITGLTINGNLTVTGNTSLQGLTATTISATTYQNLPTDIRTTGATYSNNTFTFTNNTGGTYSVLFNTVTGLTVNGNLTVTGNTSLQGLTATTISATTVSANTVTLSTTPTTNTTATSVLVRNPTTGNIEVNTINNLLNENNIVTVALTGSTGVDFNSIKAAVNSITGATSANTFSVRVAGGVYYEDPFTIPSWVSVVGESSISTIIQANNASQTLINLSDQSALFDCQVQGCTGTSVSAIVYSSSTTPQSSAISYVENVRFGANYTHAKVVAYGGANVIMQCSNVKYGGYPFTIGFYATNSGSGIGRMQLRNVTSTNGGIVTTTGLIFAKADAASCGFIVNGCLLTKASGTAAGTGFYVENGGFLRLTAVNFQRWAVGIDAPQIGTAPSIDAIALNFENNLIDVNIAHSGATGKIQGPDNFLKTIINPDAPLYEVNQDPKQITVAKKGGDFTGITEAVSYLISSGNTSSVNRYIISVGPGRFEETGIVLTNTPYVSIVGSDILQTVIVPKPGSESGTLFRLGDSNELSFMTISGMTGSGGIGINCQDTNGFSLIHKISMYDNETHIRVTSSSLDTQFYGEYVDLNGDYNYGVYVFADGGSASADLENHYNFATGGLGLPTVGYYAEGANASISVTVGQNIGQGVTDSACFLIKDNADLNISSIDVSRWDYGIFNPNVGGPVTFDIDSISIVNSSTNDLRVDQQFTTGTIQGSLSHQQISNAAPGVYWQFLDSTDGELDITRKISITFEDGTHTDTSTLIFQGSTMGVMTGGTITSIGGLSAQTASGYGYLQNPSSEIFQRIDWTDSVILLGANTNNYIYLNSSLILSASNTIPNNTENILLGRVVTNASTIEFIDQSPQKAQHTSNLFSTFNRTALGPVYATGSLVTQNATAFRINVSGGDYFFSENEFTPSGGSGITFTQYYRNGSGGWNTSATTVVQGSNFDNNGTLSGLTTSAYTKHTLYVVGDGAYEKYFLVLGQNQYTTLVQTEGADLPTPPTYFNDAVTPISSIYVQQGASNIIQFEDIRPVIGFKAGGVNASSLHANLLGLTADDHKQYLLVDGSRPMSGSLNMSGNTITNSGTINGVTIETHAARHKSGGSDPVGTATPTASAIPYADASGLLDSWVSTATTATLGKVRLSTSPVSAASPIVVGQNDTGFQSSFTGASYNTSNGIITFNYVSGGTRTITPSITITGGTNIQIVGSYPSFGVNFTGSTGSSFTGGTVTGPTYFTNGLTANTISATTYQNLPTDITITGATYNRNTGVVTYANNTGGTFTSTGYLTTATTGGTYSAGTITLNGIVGNSTGNLGTITGIDLTTGATYSNNTFTFTTNTGRTYSVLFNTVTGLTVNGALTVTGNTSLQSLTATTISATTYSNLPSQSGTGVSSLSYAPTTGVLTLTKNDTTTLTASPFIYLTGASYSNNVITFTNNTGNTSTIVLNTVTGLTVNGILTVTGNTSLQALTATTISATTYQNLPVSAITGTNGIAASNSNSNVTLRFTGGTITGSTNFVSGLTANTISATTYSNLPSQSGTGVSSLSYSETTGVLTLTKNDTTTLTASPFRYLTGASYSNNVITFTNNVGTVGSVVINTMTGLTVNGNLTVTGNTSLQGLTATTISATTYQNLPLEIITTGATYSNNTFTFTNTTGGTYSVLFNTVTGLTVNGALTVTGNTSLRALTATTISATTYQNLPVSGLTQGTNITITNNGSGNYTINSTGGGSSFTGGTVTGATNFTNGLTANTISATTYLNLSSGNLASAQARRTTNLSLPGTSSFITLNVTDVEDSPTVVAHDNVNTERIYVYSSGLYLIHYHANVGSGTSCDFEFSVVKNATTIINGSLISGKTSSTDLITTGVDTLVLLNANDYVSLYGRYVAVPTALANNIVLSVTKLEGVVGPEGPSFTGGSVVYATNFTNGLSANTFSATTYQNLPVSGLTQGTNITITNNGSGNYTINSTGGGGSFTGGTVTGATNFTGGLSANTFSATTYQGNVVTQIVAGTNVSISPAGGTGAVTINSTGGAGSTNYGAIYTTSNNFNFI